MEIIAVLIAGVIALMVGGALGYFGQRWWRARRRASVEEEVARVRESAQEEARLLLLEAKEEGLRLRTQQEEEIRERRQELQRGERRLVQREESLERKVETAERQARELSKREQEQQQQAKQLAHMEEDRRRELERVAGLSTDEARDLLLHQVEEEFREEALRRARQTMEAAEAEVDERARRILALTIQRLASEVSAETTVTVVPIPSDDMKGRIIGREGRNIRALEAATGVDLIVDDTPEAVTLSCFEPVRREIARLALQKLLVDGRIHPSRIEEMVAKAKEEVDAIMQKEGARAAQEIGVQLHPEIVKTLGRLKYRQSYGQNVLQHSIEVSHLAGMLAAEIGVDVQVAKTAGLLHDLGKALDHEVEGTHDELGADLARRYLRNPAIARAIHDHHHERDDMSIEGAIVAAADAISAARPGARKESLEQYLRRLEALEEIATSFAGVERAFAIQAGREVRIFVKPEEIDDLQALRLARDVAQKIEGNLAYPGQIKVTLIRETRVTEYAK